MSLAVLTVVGQCIGAGDYPQAMHYTKKLMIITYAAMMVVNIPILLFSDTIVRWFSLSTVAEQITQQVLPVIAISCCIVWPYSFAFPNALRAAGDARYTMIVSTCSMWAVRFGLSFLLIKQFNLGLEGVWYAMIADWVVRCVFFFFRYRGGAWKTKTVLR